MLHLVDKNCGDCRAELIA